MAAQYCCGITIFTSGENRGGMIQNRKIGASVLIRHGVVDKQTAPCYSYSLEYFDIQIIRKSLEYMAGNSPAIL